LDALERFATHAWNHQAVPVKLGELLLVDHPHAHEVIAERPALLLAGGMRRHELIRRENAGAQQERAPGGAHGNPLYYTLRGLMYLDHNATTRLFPEVRAAMSAAEGEIYGNPSSLHAAGRAAREVVERARREVAALVCALPEEIVFTSGGTEADQLAIRGAARAARAKGRGAHLVTSAIEHPAATGACEALREDGFEVSVVPATAEGIVEPDAFVRALRPDTVLASVQ